MKRSVILGLALIAGAACGPQPLTVWKVSKFEGERPDSCYVNNIPPDDKHQTGVQTDLGTWELYEGPEGKFFLAGVSVDGAAFLPSKQTLEGTFQDDVYTFDVTDTVIKKRNEGAAVITVSVQTTIKFTVDGDTFSGTWTQTDSFDCTGTACNPNFKLENPTCTVTHQIKGARVEVENLHVL
ncbi:MAG: hypothetical protein ACOX6T_14335 [Myxococcales bacterium]|jgi:hypothetical protein